MPISINTRDEFREYIIAQDDDEDYQESGWVVVVKGDFAAIARYGHCSCYDTWTALCGGGISDWVEAGDPNWDWEGTIEEMVSLATAREDPCMPGRPVDSNDIDADHLFEVYRQIISWYENRNPVRAEASDTTTLGAIRDLAQDTLRIMQSEHQSPRDKLLKAEKVMGQIVSLVKSIQ